MRYETFSCNSEKHTFEIDPLFIYHNYYYRVLTIDSIAQLLNLFDILLASCNSIFLFYYNKQLFFS